MRQFFPAAAAALILFFAAACGGGESPSPEEATLSPPLEEPSLPLPSAEPEPVPPTKEDLEAEQIDSLLRSMTIEERVGQLFFVRCPAENAAEDVEKYHLGGYILFGRDFQNDFGGWLTGEQLTDMIRGYQEAAEIPLLIGVDEEGGAVVRASRNPNLFDGKFKSPQWLWKHRDGQADVFAEDARQKNSALMELGINVNLAPVCDVSTDPGSFIYDRTLGQDAGATAAYVENVVSAMRACGMGSVLKHFPGYGDNPDTHTGIAVDSRPMERFTGGDFLPFQAGIAAGEGTSAVLVSHNIVTCMDGSLPASLSPAVHAVLREELGFDGVVMTDDLAMDAVADYAKDGAAAVMALAAGNDLVITTDYRTQIPEVLEAVGSGVLPESTVDEACRRVLAWKQALNLLEFETVRSAENP